MRIDFAKTETKLIRTVLTITSVITTLTPIAFCVAVLTDRFIVAALLLGLLMWDEMRSIRGSLQVFVDEIELDNEIEKNHE